MTCKEELLKIEKVFVHETTPEADEEIKYSGCLHLWRQENGRFIEWVPYEDLQNQSNSKSTKFTSHKFIIKFDIEDLKSVKKQSPTLSSSRLIFILKCGTTCPALHFSDGGSSLVISNLQKYIPLNRSNQDSSLYVVKDPSNEQQTKKSGKSFSEFNLFENDRGGDVLSNFFHDPYTSTLGGFSRVTKFFHDNLIPTMDAFTDQPIHYQSNNKDNKTETGVDITVMDAINDLTINTDDSGFAFISSTKKERELPTRSSVTRQSCINAKQWSSYMDEDGRISDVTSIKWAIFKGGVDNSIRQEVWKFLLGYYKWDSTYKSRIEDRKQKIDDYFRMKLQWMSFSEDQISRFAALRDRISLADKDVWRTDRKHRYFEGAHNQNIQVLKDILLTHCMHDFDLGYVQGMSDLLAPILVVMEHEVDAFWCFAGFIKLLGRNFEKDQQAMKNQLLQLQILLTFIDPQLANYLESHDSLNMYFCFRWLLIVFKREFNFPDIMSLWEVLWTGLPCKNFHLLICLAILDLQKSTLIENDFGFPEILKHINDLSGTLNVTEVLETAEAMYIQLRDCKDLTETIRNILGLCTPVDNDPSTPSPFQPFHPFETQTKLSPLPKSKSNDSSNNGTFNEVLTSQPMKGQSLMELPSNHSQPSLHTSVDTPLTTPTTTATTTTTTTANGSGTILQSYDQIDEFVCPSLQTSANEYYPKLNQCPKNEVLCSDFSDDNSIEIIEHDNSNYRHHQRF